MNVLVVEPGYLPYEKEISDLPDMQKIVGGSIQAIYPFKDEVAVVCNEDGIFLHLDYNRSIPERSYGGIFGTFFVCGIGGEEFISLTPEQMNTYKARFKKAEVLLGVHDGKPIIVTTAAKRKRSPDRPKQPPKPPRR